MRIFPRSRSDEQSPEPSAGRPRRSWGRIAGWTAAGVAGLLLLLVVVLVLVLRSGMFHNFALRKLQQVASAKLNTRVQLQNFSIHLSGLSADLYGLTIHGAPPDANVPLLQVQHIGVGVRIVSVLHKEWYLNRLRIDHPVVQVLMDDHGGSNLPKIKSSGGGSSVNIFQMGVRHVILDGGVVYFNSRKSPLEADLHDLTLHSQYAKPQQQYSIKLSYKDGHLQVGAFQPIPHELEAAFTAAPDEFHLTHAKLTSGPSSIVLAGNLKNYQNPVVSGSYSAEISGEEIRHVLNNPSIPAGIVDTSGSITYRKNGTAPLLDVVAVQGELHSNRLVVSTPKLRTEIGDLAAHYSVANGDAAVENFYARVLGGELIASANMLHLTGKTQSKLTASIHGLSLADAQSLAPKSAATRNLALRGVMNANAAASWGKTMADLVVHADTDVNAEIANRRTKDVLPLQSAIHATYRAAGSEVALAHSYLKMPHTKLSLNGTVAQRSSLAVEFRSNDLAELETMAGIFRPAPSTAPAKPMGLAGVASFQGTVRGSARNPQVAGKLVASNVQFHGTTFPVVQSDVDLNPSRASLQHAEVELASTIPQTVPSTQPPVSTTRPKMSPAGRIQFSGSVGLVRWAFDKTKPIHLQFHASKSNVAALAALAGSTPAVTGTLAANLDLHGTGKNPIGRGNIAITNAEAYDESIRSATVAFNGTLDDLHGDLLASLPAGKIHSAVTYRPVEKTYDLKLRADNFDLSKVHALQARNIAAKGQLNLDAAGKGTLQNPGLTATLTIPQLDVQNQKIADVRLDMNVANHNLVASLNSRAIDTSIQARVKVNLSGDYMTQATLDTQPIALGPVLALYAPSAGSDISGQTELHATVSGPLKKKNLLNAHLTVPVLQVAYGKTIQLAAKSPIHVDYSNGVVDLQRTTIQGTDTNLQLQGSVPVYGSAPVSVLLQGTVNLQLAQLFSSDVRSAGQLVFDINSYGARKDPNLEGKVSIVNASFSNGSLPVGLQHGNGELFLTKDRLNIKSFQGDVGGGKVTAQGGVSYRPAIQFDLGAAIQNVRLLYPQGLREELSADLRLSGNKQNALLGGTVRVSNVSFTPAFDLTSFIGNISSGVAPPPTPGFSQNLHLNLAVSSVSGVDLVSRTLSLNGNANLQVRGTAAQPVILGRINLNDGDVIFNNNRFVLNGGTIAFVNPVQTEPVVNLTLNTTIQEFNIHLRFNGPVDQVRTSYSSDPSLPSADIINLLAFGQTTEANAANPATPGSQAAEGLLASQVSSQITSRVSKIAGISQLSINPVLSGGSTQGPAGAIVTVQQRVTGNFFVTFSTNVATTQDQVIMGQYQVSPKVAVTGTRDQNGGFAFDTIFKKSW